MMRFRQRIAEESERTQRMSYDEFLQLCKDRHACILNPHSSVKEHC